MLYLVRNAQRKQLNLDCNLTLLCLTWKSKSISFDICLIGREFVHYVIQTPNATCQTSLD